MDKSPEIITKGNAEERLDYCKFDDRVCVLVSGEDCYMWEKIQKEDE